jgi:hypothetical protein
MGLVKNVEKLWKIIKIGFGGHADEKGYSPQDF